MLKSRLDRQPKPATLQDLEAVSWVFRFKQKIKVTNFQQHISFLAHLSRRLTGELIVYPCSGVRRCPSASVVRQLSTISKIFSSETARPIKAKLHVEHP